MHHTTCRRLCSRLQSVESGKCEFQIKTTITQLVCSSNNATKEYGLKSVTSRVVSLLFTIVNIETNKCGGCIFSGVDATLKFISLHEF